MFTTILIKTSHLSMAIIMTICLTVMGLSAAGNGKKSSVTNANIINKNIVRGAIYIPAKAYNAPQMWKNYSPEETRRDMGYAGKIRLNAFRVWISYEYWLEEPDQFKKSFDDFLKAGEENKIRILCSLFENCGVPPTKKNLWTTDPQKAFAINSPHKNIAKDPGQWEKPREFIRWFMNNYKNDLRLLAIEIMNEPRNNKKANTMNFAKDMFKTAVSMRGKVPLTIGTANLDEAEQFFALGLDVIQFHANFPPDKKAMEDEIEKAIKTGREKKLPVWLTEWQRIRPSGQGFGNKPIADTDKYSDYSSLAETVQKYEIGTFFWSLMVKKAYLPDQRKNGTINGLFWEDGAVWSMKDARAISNIFDLNLTERRDIPPDFLK